MKISEMIKELQEHQAVNGDLDIAIVHPTGVYKNIVILSGTSDYWDGGHGLLGGDCVGGHLVIDYD